MPKKRGVCQKGGVGYVMCKKRGVLVWLLFFLNRKYEVPMFTNSILYMHEIGGVPVEIKFKCADCYYYDDEYNFCNHLLKKVDNPDSSWCMGYIRVSFTQNTDVK